MHLLLIIRGYLHFFLKSPLYRSRKKTDAFIQVTELRVQSPPVYLQQWREGLNVRRKTKQNYKANITICHSGKWCGAKLICGAVTALKDRYIVLVVSDVVHLCFMRMCLQLGH